MPRYYPILVDLHRLPCLVVGGGGVALRKVRTLLDHKARVTVVAAEASAALRQIAACVKSCSRWQSAKDGA